MTSELEIRSSEAVNFIVFDDDFLKEPIKELISELDDSKKNIIYINSDGGTVYYVDLLIDIIRYYDIELVFPEVASSACFTLLAKADCPKRLLEGFRFSCLHIYSVEVEVRDLLKPKSDICQKDIKQIHAVNARLIELFEEINVPAKYIARIKKGHDVYLDRSEVLKLSIKNLVG